jgi:hypothetical protein
MAFGADFSEVDLVLTLGAVILRTSKDHEAAIRLREVATVLGWHPLIFGHLLVAVPALALGRLTKHAHEKFAVLELVLDRVAMIGASLFQELLKLVGDALSLARMVDHHDRVGVGTTPVLLFLFPLPRGRAHILVLPLGLSFGPTISEDRPTCLLAGGVVRGNVQELAGGA